MRTFQAIFLAMCVCAPMFGLSAPVAAQERSGVNGISSPAVAKVPLTEPSLWEEAHADMVLRQNFLDLAHNGGLSQTYLQRSWSYGTEFYAWTQGHHLIGVRPSNEAEFLAELGRDHLDPVIQSGSLGVRLERIALTGGTLMSFVATAMILLVMLLLARKHLGTPFRRTGGRKAGATFADVAGQSEAKRNLQEVLDGLRNPKSYRKLGISVPRGVLMDGPPGNGKTLLARAMAGEANVPFFHASGADFHEMFAGLGAKRMKAAFKAAGRHRKGAILFIDELDAIGGKRGGGIGDSVQKDREGVLNTMLVLMDGLQKRRRNIIVVGATNRPETLDDALVRPGRFDRKVHVANPTQVEREQILRLHGAKVPLAGDVDFPALARLTPTSSGADLSSLVNEAAFVAARTGRDLVDMHCFHEARDRALMGDARPSDAIQPHERELTAYHEAGHALVALRSLHADPVYKVTIEPRGRSLGMVMLVPEHENQLLSRAKLESDLMVALAGRAAETLIYGKDRVTTGASSDIQQATQVARAMGGQLGMFEELGMMAFWSADGQPLCSPDRMAALDRAVAFRLHEASNNAIAAISAERAGFIALAQALLERRTLTGAEALAILDAHKEVSAELSAPLQMEKDDDAPSEQYRSGAARRLLRID